MAGQTVWRRKRTRPETHCLHWRQRRYRHFLPIEGVKKHYDNPLDVAKDSLAHEEAVSASIRSLVKLAREEGDLETEIFLQWYVTEQIEEEVNARDNITGFEKAQEGAALLYMFDNHLGDR